MDEIDDAVADQETSLGEPPHNTTAAMSPAVRARVRPRAFLGLAIVLLVVFVGFSPTFYLDPLFDTPTRVTSIVYPDARPMPAFLILHGVVMTAWFVGLVVQSGLIVLGRQQVHRLLGALGVGLSVRDDRSASRS